MKGSVPLRDLDEVLPPEAEKLRLLAESIGEVCWFMELNPTRLTYVSPGFERLWGLPVANLYADPQCWEQAIHPDDAPAVRAAFQQWASGKRVTFGMEYRVIHPDGRVHWISDRGIVVTHRENQPHTLCGIARDVTERKLADQKFRGLLESAPDAMIVVNERGVIDLVNAQTERLFGYSRAELIGQALEILVPERFLGHHAGYRANYAHAPHTRTMGEGRELFARRKDGSEFPTEISLSPLVTTEGRVTICTARDITERKLAEQTLSHALSFAEAALEAVPASLAVLDEDGKIIGTNHAWHEFAAANAGKLEAIDKGANYLSVCEAAAANGDDGAAAFAAGVRQVMSGVSQRFSMEYPCHSPTEQRWFVGYVTPFEGNGPHSVVIAHVDISERKRAEQVIRRLNDELENRVAQRTQELRAANEGLREQIAMRRQLEAEILHISEREQQRIGQDLHDDLGQQLTGIWCFSQVLQTELKRAHSPLVQDAKKITGLLKDALALTRSLARGLHPVAVQAGGIIPALEELAARISDLFHIQCRCHCPTSIEMDNTTATHLYRIAQEAVTNAVKHGQAKVIYIELSTNAHQTVLSIKDQGQGLAPLDPKHKGMGTRIMKYRADMIGGTIHLQNNATGSGAIVTCTLPAATTKPQPPTPTYGYQENNSGH